MDRKSFLQKLPFWAAGQALSVIDHQDKVKQRPPGAIEESEFQSTCTGCDACMMACPHNLIFIEDMENRDPLIYPDENPCVMCASFPCIQACEVGALELKDDEAPTLRTL